MTPFWIVAIETGQLSVSLVDQNQTITTGTTNSWNPDDNSILDSVNDSLSQVSQTLNLSSGEEPSGAAFIVPPTWVNQDGKITPVFLPKIEMICRQLSLKPLGFISHTEAVVEYLNGSEGVGVSFILIEVGSSSFDLSLVYLGQIKKRLQRQFSPPFGPSIIESTLVELNSESALPPQIILLGQIDDSIVTSFKNYPWLGKKDYETFLHLPQIKSYSDKDLINIYSKVILTQTQSVSSLPPPPPAPAVNQVSPESLGFNPTSAPTSKPPLPTPSPPPKKIILPKIKLPHFRPKFKITFFYPLIFSPLIFLVFMFFLRSRLTIFVNPYIFSERFPVVLDSQSSSLNSQTNSIPVSAKNFTVTATSSVPATGKTTVGDKAKGEITIFNQQPKIQPLPKGTILVDDKNHQFELFAPVSVAASTFNLDQGVITLGQVRASIIAVDIGEEYNLPAETKLTFKDFSESTLLARILAPPSGGSRRQTSAVAAADRRLLEEKLAPLLEAKISEKIAEETKNNSLLIKSSLQTKKERPEFSREVNEEAQDLTATLSASITLFILGSSPEEITANFLGNHPDFSKFNFDQSAPQLDFELTKISQTQALGTIVLSGQVIPAIDFEKLKKALVFQTPSATAAILKKQVDRYYNFELKPYFLLPLKKENIDINVKISN